MGMKKAQEAQETFTRGARQYGSREAVRAVHSTTGIKSARRKCKGTSLAET
jgi:hypothetical protein